MINSLKFNMYFQHLIYKIIFLVISLLLLKGNTVECMDKDLEYEEYKSIWEYLPSEEGEGEQEIATNYPIWEELPPEIPPENKDELAKKAIALFNRLEDPEQIRKFQEYLHKNLGVSAEEQGNNLGVSSEEQVFKPRHPSLDNNYAYLMAGIGVIVIGVILWTHREVFSEFIFNLTHNSIEVIRHVTIKSLNQANIEQLTNAILYLQKTSTNPPTVG